MAGRATPSEGVSGPEDAPGGAVYVHLTATEIDVLEQGLYAHADYLATWDGLEDLKRKIELAAAAAEKENGCST